MESWWATLKKEVIYREPTTAMKREDVKSDVFRYAYGYYNRRRVTLTNPEGLPPAIYRERHGDGAPRDPEPSRV